MEIPWVAVATMAEPVVVVRVVAEARLQDVFLVRIPSPFAAFPAEMVFPAHSLRPLNQTAKHAVPAVMEVLLWSFD